MKSNPFTLERIQKMYDRFSSIPWIWEIDAITCRATQNSPYRAQAIKLLKLDSNSKVLDVACGTGLNFSLIQKYLKSQGLLTGIDLSNKTLKLAQKRITENKWKNIELVQTDAANFKGENLYDAVLCTFAIEIIPTYRETLDMMCRVVKPGGRIAIIGFKPSTWRFYRHFNSIYKNVSVYFGGLGLGRDVRSYINNRYNEIYYQEVFGGFYYILVVQKTK